MNVELLNETVSAYFAGHVDMVLGDCVRVTDREFDPLTDVCTVWTSSASKDIAHSIYALQERLRARTGVKDVSIYATKKGFSVVLTGCIDEYKKWSSRQLRISASERIIYLLLGVLAAAICFVLYLCNK